MAATLPWQPPHLLRLLTLELGLCKSSPLPPPPPGAPSLPLDLLTRGWHERALVSAMAELTGAVPSGGRAAASVSGAGAVIRARNRMSVRRITRQQIIFVRKDCIHKN